MSRLVFGRPDLLGHRDVVACEDGSIRVRLLPKSEADDIIRRGHYSGSVVWSSSFHFGVEYGGKTIGALQYGPAMNPASGGRVVRDCAPGEWLELNRMWLSDDRPENCATRAVSFSLRLLQKLRPQLTWVQSFADSRCGKLGAVYQAASFLYLGSHESTFYEIDGQWFHKSMKGRAEVDKRGWWSGPKVAFFRANEHRATPHVFTQYRYVKLLDRRVARRLLLEPQPYPKPHPIACDMDEDCGCSEVA